MLVISKRCSAYLDRPKRCRQFRCKTLRALETGTLSRAQSLERIDVLLKRIELIESAVAVESRSAFWWAAALIADPNTDSAQRVQLSEALEAALEELAEYRSLANEWIASPDDLIQWSHE